VARFRILLIIAFALSATTGPFIHGQDSDGGRKGEPVKADATELPPPTPTAKPKAKSKVSPSPSPKGKAKPKPSESSKLGSSATPKESPSATLKAKAANKSSSDDDEDRPAKAKTAKKKSSDDEEATPKPKKSSSPTAKGKPSKKKSTAKKEETPKKKKSAKAKGEEVAEKTPKAKAAPSALSATPTERPTAPLPRAAIAPTSVPTIAPIEEEPAQVTIEKPGYEKPRGFFARLFGNGGSRSSSGGSYRYLTNSVRSEIDRAPVMARRWQFIVVHNSGTRQGNAAAFDYYHKHVRRMQNGLAYHFVIGNGTSTGNGQIEVGNRWRRQINGGHVHSDYLNNIALGICLVGDFNRDQPTRAQLDCCEELIRYLRQRCGKIDNHYAIVKPHREVNPPRWATDCPGDAFPYSWFRRF